MKKIAENKKTELIGGYDIMACALLATMIGPLSNTLTNGQWLWAVETYVAFCAV
jgi:hypothetical protein